MTIPSAIRPLMFAAALVPGFALAAPAHASPTCFGLDTSPFGCAGGVLSSSQPMPVYPIPRAYDPTDSYYPYPTYAHYGYPSAGYYYPPYPAYYGPSTAYYGGGGYGTYQGWRY